MYFLETDTWYLERVVLLIAGVLVLAGSILAWVHSIYWLILTLLVGLNLLIFATTGFCLAGAILYKMGVKPKLERSERT
jgi:hypothetical protein